MSVPYLTNFHVDFGDIVHEIAHRESQNNTWEIYNGKEKKSEDAANWERSIEVRIVSCVIRCCERREIKEKGRE